MTVEERLADLERRLSQVERITTPLMPLGPRIDHEQLDKERAATAERINAELLRRKAAEEIPVDRSARELINGLPESAMPDYRETTSSGMQKSYVVLSPEERAKGFVRQVRRSYLHKPCGAVTTMGLALAETYARDPKFYGGTFCATCRAHFSLDQFVWEGTDEQVGS